MPKKTTSQIQDYPSKEDLKDAQQLAREVSPLLLELFEAEEKPEKEKPKDDK